MYWQLFLIFCIFSGIFLFFGYNYKSRLYVIMGSLFMVFVGFVVITNGLYIPNGYNVTYDSFDINKVQVDTNTTESTITVSNAQLIPNYEHIEKDNVYAQWLFGLLFILAGALIGFDAFFSDRFARFL